MIHQIAMNKTKPITPKVRVWDLVSSPLKLNKDMDVIEISPNSKNELGDKIGKLIWN
jgi:hypothetical protein